MNHHLLLTIAEAAALLRLSRVTVYRLIAKGELRPVHIGRAVRIPRSELERFARVLTEVGRVDTQ